MPVSCTAFPCGRNVVVEDCVLDGPNARHIDEAENRLSCPESHPYELMEPVVIKISGSLTDQPGAAGTDFRLRRAGRFNSHGR